MISRWDTSDTLVHSEYRILALREAIQERRREKERGLVARV
jgi:hypothetical protein